MDGVQSNYFYHYPTANEEPVQIFDIPELFQVDEEEFEKWVDQFYEQIKNLWKEFQQSGHEPWTTFTMVFDHSGKFHVEYGYEDLSKTDHYDRRIIWEYKSWAHSKRRLCQKDFGRIFEGY
ncbi:antitoxin YezG family protein [Polycladomyces subterraneus]|uniref:Antitoxin YezG family protein n=1 Tax=Polycladomyces subterraneus TaxID=1016997 RepID=A0ABT8IID1_9BACL|nr:antitoxin YezG family protein [Polycladomyces subterraneus]